MKTKKDHPEIQSFGRRLAKLRKAAGYTQKELASELGVTRRIIVYYECESEHPPTTLLIDLARVLGVTTDELLGVEKIPERTKPGRTRLQRKLQEIEQLPAKERRQLIQFIDTFVERDKLRKRAVQ